MSGPSAVVATLFLFLSSLLTGVIRAGRPFNVYDPSCRDAVHRARPPAFRVLWAPGIKDHKARRFVHTLAAQQTSWCWAHPRSLYKREDNVGERITSSLIQRWTRGIKLQHAVVRRVRPGGTSEALRTRSATRFVGGHQNA